MFQYSQQWSEVWLLRWKKKLIVLLSLWSDDMDIEAREVFEKRHLGGTDQRSYSFSSA